MVKVVLPSVGCLRVFGNYIVADIEYACSMFKELTYSGDILVRDRVFRGVGKVWFCPPRDTGDDSILDIEESPLLQEKDTGRGKRLRDAGSSEMGVLSWFALHRARGKEAALCRYNLEGDSARKIRIIADVGSPLPFEHVLE